MLVSSKGKEHTTMTNEEVKVYLQYTKVLLAIDKINDKQVNEALDIAIDNYEEDKNAERHYLM